MDTMNRYNKYHIKDTDLFDINDFPKVENELDHLVKATVETESTNKDQIIISYLKNHALEKDWVDNNPEFTGQLTGGQFITGQVESLFESCRQNKPFTEGFEAYIRTRIKTE